MHKTVAVLAASMILFGSIVASEAEEKQNPGGTGGGGVPGQPTTTAPKKPTTTVPKQPTTTAPTQPPVLGLKSVVCTPPPPPPPVQCPSNAASCTYHCSFTRVAQPRRETRYAPQPVTVTTSNPASCAAGYLAGIARPARAERLLPARARHVRSTDGGAGRARVHRVYRRRVRDQNPELIRRQRASRSAVPREVLPFGQSEVCDALTAAAAQPNFGAPFAGSDGSSQRSPERQGGGQ